MISYKAATWLGGSAIMMQHSDLIETIEYLTTERDKNPVSSEQWMFLNGQINIMNKMFVTLKEHMIKNTGS